MTSSSSGHRKRLRERYKRAGLEGFSDREALELLLSFVIPRKDTKPLAVNLIERFGSLGQVLKQPPEMLQGQKGVGPAAAVLLSMVRHMAARSMRPSENLKVLQSPDSVREYLRHSMGSQRRERLVALMLDSSNRLLCESVVDFGTVNQASVSPRNLVEKVVSTGATAVILVHNHPGGRLAPSGKDLELTRKLAALGKSLDFQVLDHLIVTEEGSLSLSEEGLMPV